MGPRMAWEEKLFPATLGVLIRGVKSNSRFIKLILICLNTSSVPTYERKMIHQN
jgi:hypothetical protein